MRPLNNRFDPAGPQGESRRNRHRDRRKRSRNGFTLIELMIVVAILSIMASLAVAAFNGYVRKSKTAEATRNLSHMFKAVSSYYNTERTGQGLTNTTGGYCTIDSQPTTPSTPGRNKQMFLVTPGFSAIGFKVLDFVYYGYGITSAGEACGWAPNTNAIYTLFAHGDVDGDATWSTFNMAVGSDNENTLYHGRGFFIINESE